jgi:hypothetical protein
MRWWAVTSLPEPPSRRSCQRVDEHVDGGSGRRARRWPAQGRRVGRCGAGRGPGGSVLRCSWGLCGSVWRRESAASVAVSPQTWPPAVAQVSKSVRWQSSVRQSRTAGRPPTGSLLASEARERAAMRSRARISRVSAGCPGVRVVVPARADRWSLRWAAAVLGDESGYPQHDGHGISRSAGYGSMSRAVITARSRTGIGSGTRPRGLDW